MPNKYYRHKREDWISIVITMVFVLGFLLLVNTGTSPIGFAAIEPIAVETTQTFEVNEVIPSTATLEIISGTQQVQQNLSEFTVKLSELQNIQPVLENGSLVAYNITNITIDLSKYNIQPVDEVTLRFIEVYKEITIESVTKKVTKEEVIEKEIVAVTEPIENITVTEEPEFAIQPAEEINFNITAAAARFDDVAIAPAEDSTYSSSTSFWVEVTYDNTKANTYDCYGGLSSGADTDDEITTTDQGANTIGLSENADGCRVLAVDVTGCGGGGCVDNGDGRSHWTGTTTYSGQVVKYQVLCVNAGNFDISTLAAASWAYCDPGDFRSDLWVQNVTITAPANNPPVVEIHWPENNTYSFVHSVNFTYNVTDTDGTPINCTLLIQNANGWQPNKSNKSAIIESVNQTINITLGHESINWTVQCEDNSGDKANATIYNFTVYDAAATVKSVFPNNNSNSLSHSANFTYNVTSPDGLINCTLLLQKAGDWHPNKSNATAITEDVNQTINITLGHESVNWTIQCENSYDEKVNSTIRNYTVYDSAPIVKLVWPANNTYQTSSLNVNLTYNVTGRDSTYTCNLFINHEYNKSDANIEQDVNQTFNLTFASYQNFNWTVLCNSTYNEKANSTTRNYSLIEQINTAPFIPIGNITFPAATQSITLNDHKNVSMQFAVCDADDLTGLKVYANVTGENTTGRRHLRNITCEQTAWPGNTTCLQYNCTFKLWYFYNPGDWNISMNATDGSLWAHQNLSTLDLQETTGITVTSNISFGILNAGNTNKTSTTDPIIVNNTGNKNISYGLINITAYNLIGEETKTDYIPAVNFSIGTHTGGSCSGADCWECSINETYMVNETTANITSSMLPRGNHSVNSGEIGQEYLYVCLRQVPSGIAAQAYSTDELGAWVIEII